MTSSRLARAARLAAVSIIGLSGLARAGTPPVLQSEGLRIEIDPGGGLPSAWTACAGDCDKPGVLSRTLIGRAGGGRLRWHAPDVPGLAAALAAARYRVDWSPGPVLTLVSTAPVAGQIREHRYWIDADRGLLMAELDLPAGAGLALEMGAAFVPEPLPGFGALYGAVRAVRVGSDGQQVLGPDGNGELAVPVSATDWAGLRNRFWALLWRFDQSGTFSVEPGAPEQPRVLLAPGAGARVRVEAYGGPVEARSLAAADRVLHELLFAALWDWLRALCFGLLWLLSWIQGLGVASTGLAIVLLSVTVKLLMWPLTHVADRWQAEVNQTQARLQPRLDEIKRNFRGEEAHNLVLAAYREHGVHPLFTLKSLAGFLIQIPVFIAAFDMLGENFVLNQAAFAWIDDLAKPDRLAALPFALPFFGGHLNLLPFLMTGFTLLASRLQADPDLTPSLARQQRLRLYLMALVFFVLFYTFPAGMVLYWTTNNVLHLLKILGGRILGRASRDRLA